MKTKRLIIFAIVLVVLAVLALRKQGFWQEKSEGPQGVFLKIKVEEAIKIQTKKGDKEVSLLKKDGHWFVTKKKKSYRAVDDFIKELLNKLPLVRIDRVASRQKEKHALFEVDAEKGLEVKISGKGEKALAHFYLGKQGSDYMSSYLRQDGSDEVLVIGENLSYIFGRPDWRERKVFDAKVEDVKKLILSYPKQEIILVQDKEKGWQLEAPQAGAAQKEEVTNLFSTLTSLRIVQFVEEAVKEDETGLKEPALKISWYLDGDGQGGLLLGKTKTGLRYVQQEGDENVVMVPENRLKPLWEKAAKLSQPAPEPKESDQTPDQGKENKEEKEKKKPAPPAKK